MTMWVGGCIENMTCWLLGDEEDDGDGGLRGAREIPDVCMEILARNRLCPTDSLSIEKMAVNVWCHREKKLNQEKHDVNLFFLRGQGKWTYECVYSGL